MGGKMKIGDKVWFFAYSTTGTKELRVGTYMSKRDGLYLIKSNSTFYKRDFKDIAKVTGKEKLDFLTKCR